MKSKPLLFLFIALAVAAVLVVFAGRGTEEPLSGRDSSASGSQRLPDSDQVGPAGPGDGVPKRPASTARKVFEHTGEGVNETIDRWGVPSESVYELSPVAAESGVNADSAGGRGFVAINDGRSVQVAPEALGPRRAESKVAGPGPGDGETVDLGLPPEANDPGDYGPAPEALDAGMPVSGPISEAIDPNDPGPGGYEPDDGAGPPD